MMHQVLVAVPIALEGDQRGEHVASNMSERGRPIAGNDCEGVLAIDLGSGPTSSGRTYPTPSRLCNAPCVSPEWQSSALSSPPSRGEVALHEILSVSASVPMYWISLATINFGSEFLVCPFQRAHLNPLPGTHRSTEKFNILIIYHESMTNSKVFLFLNIFKNFPY